MNEDTTAATPGSNLATPLADAADDAVRIVGENVGLVIVGGLAAGLLAAALLPRSKKRKLKKRSHKIADMVADLGEALVAQIGDAASEGRDRLTSLTQSAGAAVSDYSHDLSKQSTTAAQKASSQLNDSGKAIARTLVKLIEKARP